MGKINHYSEEAFNATVEINSGLKDAGGHLGTSGQVLSSTGTGTDWITLASNTDNYVDSVSFTKSSSTLSVGRTGALSTFNTVLKSLTGDVVSNLDTPTNSSNALMYYDRFSNNPTGDIPGSTNNANGILTMISHSGPYGKQIGFGDNDEMYIRKFSNNVMGSWRRLLFPENLADGIGNEANGNVITDIVGLDGNSDLTTRSPAQFISTNNLAQFDTGTLDNRHFLLYDSSTGKARTSILKVNSLEQLVDVAGTLKADFVSSEGNISLDEGNPLILDSDGDNFEYILTNVNYNAFTSASGAPQGMMYAASSAGHHFINGEEQVYNNATWQGDSTVYADVKAKSFIKQGGTSSQFLKADGSVDSSSYLTSIPSTYVTTNTTQDITGDKRFTSDTVYFGTDANNSAEIIIDTTNGGSPQISYTESNDASWATGVDDSDNSFKIHGASSTTVPTIANLATPIFELTTGGEAFINGNKVFHAGNDGSGSGLSADTFRGVSIDGFLRSDVGDSKSGYLKVFGASFTSGTDTVTDTAIIQEKGNYLYGDDGSYLRRLIGWATDGKLEIGQNSTSLITQINLMPGNAGNDGVKINGNTVWNAGNDSTLVKTNTTQTITGNKDFNGGLSVTSGTNGERFTIKRNDSSSATGGVGGLGDDVMEVHLDDNSAYFDINNDGDGDSATFLFRRKAAGVFENLLTVSSSVINFGSNKIFHAGNDGSGSGLDADLLDGLHGSSYVKTSTNQSVAGQKTFTDDIFIEDAIKWQVNSGDVANQRADARDDGTEAILHWYGQNTSNSAKAMKHNWYDGSTYIEVRPSASTVAFTRQSGSANLSASGTMTATNFILSSDKNLKKNIEDLKPEEIKVDWKTYELKSDEGQKRYGVIAQDLLETNPEFVRQNEETKEYSVAYVDLLVAKVAELEAKNKSLESRLERLESIIENL